MSILKREISKSENPINNLKVLFGAVIFIVFGFFISSVYVDASMHLKNLVTQLFLFILFVSVISFRSYYFSEIDDTYEFIGKIFLFGLLLLPNELLFWTNNFVQPLAYLISFMSTLVFCLAYQFKSQKEGDNSFLLLLFTTTWTLLSALIIFKQASIVPSNLIQKFSFLHLDALENIRIIIGVFIIIYLLVISVAHGLEKKPVWRSYAIKKKTLPKLRSSSSDLMKFFYVLPQVVINVFINPIIIGVILNLVFFGIFRIIIDFLLRVCRQFVIELWHLLKKTHIVLLFLVLHILSVAIPYIIFIIANPLIYYISGVDEYFNFALRWLFILIAVAIFFKVFVTLLFTELIIPEKTERSLPQNHDLRKEPNSFSNDLRETSLIYNSIKEPLFSSTIAVLVIGTLVWMSGLLLWALHSPLHLKGFQTWGLFTKYFTYLFGLIMLIVILWSITAKKQNDDPFEEERVFFRFSELNWNPVKSKAWWLIGLILIVLSTYAYANGSLKFIDRILGKSGSLDTTRVLVDSVSVNPKTDSLAINFLKTQKLKQDSLKKLIDSTIQSDLAQRLLEENLKIDSIRLSNSKGKESKGQIRGTVDNKNSVSDNAQKEKNSKDTFINTGDDFEEPLPIFRPSKLDNPYGEGNGNLSVYSTCSFCRDMKVYVDEKHIGTLTTYYENSPSCNSSGSISKPLSVGYHYVRVEDSDGNTWSKGVTIIEGKCYNQGFTKINSYGNGNGRIVFWTACSNCIWDIYVDGQYVGSTKYYRTTNPSCSSTDVLSFDLPAGYHAFRAEVNNIRVSGSVTVSQGNCSFVRLSPNE